MELAGYKIEQLIHKGYHSEVYHGIRVSDNVPVVIKVSSSDKISVFHTGRLKHEYSIGHSCQSPYVVKYLSLEAYGSSYAIVQEFFSGVPLSNIIKVNGLEVDLFLKIACQLVKGLTAIHQKNIVHSDIKPDNILVNPETHEVKIIDFGLASKYFKKELPIAEKSSIKGTLFYVSPEQTGRINRSVDYRSDFYSLGVTFYQMLTGQLPFTGQDELGIVYCHIAKHPLAPVVVKPGIPAPLSNLILKLMAKSQEERYQSAEGLYYDLKHCRDLLAQEKVIHDFPLGSNDISETLNIPVKLYGREKELANLYSAFKRSSHGALEMLLVTGYSGIGKSSLINELQKPVSLQNGYFVSGKFDKLHRNLPYFAIRSALSNWCRLLLTETEQRIQMVKSNILNAVGDNGQVLIDIIPELELIIGPQPEVPQGAPQDNLNRFNVLFHKFIQVIAQPAHPLVVFIDDLQWIDMASLHLLKQLLFNSENQHVLVIGAFRDNEVDQYHPLAKMMEDLKGHDTNFSIIRLDNLSYNNVKMMLNDCFQHKSPSVDSLVKLMYEKTRGNAFFVRNFIASLYEENSLYFDSKSKRWNWNLDAIVAKNITDNVVDLMISRLERLPGDALEILQKGACIGNSFDLQQLTIICEKDLDYLSAQLKTAANEGFLTPLDLNVKRAKSKALNISEGQGSLFKFTHDRIQEATYSLIPAETCEDVHLKIGYLLLKNASPKQLRSGIFNIVEQLNKGVSKITSSQKRLQLCELNFEAAKKAKKAMAFDTELSYLQKGLTLLPDSHWQTHYELSYQLYLECLECNSILADIDESDKLFTILAANIKREDMAAVYIIKMNEAARLGGYEHNIELGLKALKGYGVDLPERSDLDAWEKLFNNEYKAFIKKMKSKDVAELYDLPVATDQDVIYKQEILGAMLDAVSLYRKELLPAICFIMNNLAIKHGNSSISALGYIFTGVTYGSVFYDYERADQYGKLAIKLNTEKLINPRYTARLKSTYGILLNYYTTPLQNSVDILNEAYNAGVLSGDFLFASYAFYIRFRYLLFQGFVLKNAVAECHNVKLKCDTQLKNPAMSEMLRMTEAFLRNLIGQTSSPDSFDTDSFDENEWVKHFQVSSPAPMLINIYKFYKLQSFYIHGLYDDAYDILKDKDAILLTEDSFIDGFFFRFFMLLTLCELCHERSTEFVSTHLPLIKEYTKHLKKASELCPDNYLCLYQIAAAEVARLEGQNELVIKLHHDAIDSANSYGFIQYEALAHELALSFWHEQKNQYYTLLHFMNASDLYQRWGALAKVNQLMDMYPLLVKKIQESESKKQSSFDSVTKTSSKLDLDAISKASQALATEIDLKKLITRVLQIVVENAGAQRGVLIVKDLDEFYLEGIIDLEQDRIDVLQRIPVSLLGDEEVFVDSDRKTQLEHAAISSLFPESIVRYVVRSGQQKLLNNAMAPSEFQNDPYFIENEPRSVLCLPLRLKDEIYGAFYLENNLASQIFTEKRAEVLDILLAQVGIYIENAKLFQQRERYACQLQKERDYSLSIIESSQAIIFGVSLDGTINFINNSGERITGYDRRELIGHKWWTMLCETNEYDQSRQIHHDIVAQNISNFEMILTTKESDKRNIEWNCMCRYDQNNQVSEVIGFGLYITERKKAEIELLKTKSYLDNVINSMPSILIGVDSANCITSLNREAELQLGIDLNKVVGQPVCSIMPEYSAYVKDLEKAFISKVHFSQEKIKTVKNNSVKVSNLTVYPLVTNGIEGAVIRVDDVTEKVRMEEMLIQSEKMMTLGGLAAGMAHEINNPITAILGGVHIIQNSLKENKRNLDTAEKCGVSLEGVKLFLEKSNALKMVENIYNAGRRTAEISANMLNFSRISESNFQESDINQLLDDSLNLAAQGYSRNSKLNFRQINIIKDYADDIPLVRVIKTEIEQVLINILKNAEQALAGMDVQKKQAEILVKTEYNDDKIIITITDNGPGIPEHIQDKIFTPFFTTKDIGVGTGLGLSISSFIINERHKGQISIQTVQNQGTSFIIELPR